MSEDLAISGTLADIRRVKTRKVIQVIIEVPEEHHAHVHQVLGWDYDTTQVALAVINPNVSKVNDEPKAEKQRQKWIDLPYPQQAAMRCNEKAFQEFLNARDAEVAAHVVRKRCGVESRSEIKRDTVAGGSWMALEKEYLIWLRASGQAA